MRIITTRGPVGLTVLILLAAALVSGAGLPEQDADPSEAPSDPGEAIQQAVAQSSAEVFLDRYVDDTGRTVRRDQGGDTVSEGQAYSLLLALALGDRDRFRLIWQWTRDNLQRPDKLLSWRWDSGVADRASASDADLDAARALVVAGQRFGAPDLTREGVAMGRGLLDQETVAPAGALRHDRLLLPGSWADRDAPYLVNPSYVSPAATQALRRASGDPRWRQLESGSRKVIARVSTSEQLPPDWAQVEADGSVRPVAGPTGQPELFGFEAARVVPRHAESADADDRANAAGTRTRLWAHSPARALYDLVGEPRSEWASPLAYTARAASSVADGHVDEGAVAMGEAETISRSYPSYYGDAWTALGWMLVTRGSLDGGTPGTAS